MTNQLVNSYKRLIPGFEAPVTISWARSNRSALVRVPSIKKGKSDSARVEFRSPDPACNPYLAFAVMLAAGLEGIKNEYELGPEAPADLFKLSATEMAEAGHKQLPNSLAEALDQMEESELVRSVLGDHLFGWFLTNKRREFLEYKTQVSQFELDRYLRNT